MIKDLFIRYGKASHTKTAYNVGWIIGSIVIVVELYRGTLTSDIFQTYLGVLMLGTFLSGATNTYENTKTFQSQKNIKVDIPDV